MPLEIGIVPSFSLYISSNATDLQLPAIDLIPIGNNQEDNILIKSANCKVQGNPKYLAEQIQDAYERLFEEIPFTLNSPKRFLTVCQPSQQLPPKADFELEITVTFLFQKSQYTKKQKCSLFWQNKIRKVEMIKHDGWLAIDLGTSNSTVTFFDLNERPQPNDLSREQKEQFFRLFINWLDSPPNKALPNVSENTWREFLRQININLNSELQDILAKDNSFQFLEAIRQMEIYLGGRQGVLEREVTKKLNHIYHEVFQTPPLQEEHLVPAELDENQPPGQKQIISELEIKNVGDKLEVEMGSLVPKTRLNTISQAHEQEEFWKKIEGRFHQSPKRYLGKEGAFNIHINGQNYEIEYKKLIQAALQHLIELTHRFKDKEENTTRCSPGNFYRAIVTYPTVASPLIRREIEELVHKLEFTDVNISYDEAIAAAIFYIWREFSGNKNIGLEAFKTRCRRSGDNWFQNVLVIDIGGGTTDIALIRLHLKEIDETFELDEDRGAGGRYYLLTPNLRGSSGHLQLGGELITLKLFRLLKVAIADSLLTAVTENKLTNPQLERLINSLDVRFRLEDKYRSHSLLTCIDKENPEGDSGYKLALDYAEEVIHTRWKENPEYLQAFYTLWEWAEKAKIQLSKSSQDYELPWNDLAELLTQNNNDLDFAELKLNIKLNKQQLETAATSVVEEAVRIAKGLLDSRLGDKSNNQEEQQEPLDWLILSGQTCHLDLVKLKINELFSLTKSKLTWNPARITFVPEYAKLATSVGACYAWKLQQYSYNPKGAKSKLYRGDSELFIEVKNLLYILPCSFLGVTQDGRSVEEIFEPRQSLDILDDTRVAKARSKWFPVQATISVLRKDFDSAKAIPWANYNFQALGQKIGVPINTLESLVPFKVQFEVNQKLEISLLLCRENPHYLIASDSDINVINKLSDALERKELQDQTVPQEFISNGKLQWGIAVGVAENSPHSVFEPELVLSQNFRNQNDEEPPRMGLISQKLPPFPNNGKQTVYAFYPSMEQQKHMLPIGELTPPEGNVKENYPYYITIDDQGCLRLHEGEVPYWTSKEEEDQEVLKNKAGCVVRVNPNLQKQKDDDERNPFCGLH